jgi:hypothetical protein
MSTDKPADKPASPKAPAGATRIRHVRLVTKGLIISRPNEAEDQVAAREDGRPKGYDIWYFSNQRRFRFDAYDGNQLQRVKWMPESRIDVFEEWDPAI